jgi:hypothetical protein
MESDNCWVKILPYAFAVCVNLERVISTHKVSLSLVMESGTHLLCRVVVSTKVVGTCFMLSRICLSYYHMLCHVVFLLNASCFSLLPVLSVAKLAEVESLQLLVHSHFE